jgi:lysophospholipase-3
MRRIEEMYHANRRLPIVLVCHSMGCKMGHYFLNFCLEKKGQAWLDTYIHSYMPVGAPHLGVSLSVRAGATGQGLNDQVDMMMEGDDEGLVLYRQV